jgi:hypothetical protein
MLPLLAAASPVGAGEVTLVDGVPLVRNVALPELGVERLRLQEMWRAGGEDDETVFGLVLQALAGPDGRLYLLDGKLCEVAVFSPAGERLGALSRRGEGPGEIRNPVDMVLLPENRLGLLQHVPAVMTIIDLDGTPAGTFRPRANIPGGDAFVQLFDAETVGDELVLAYRRRQGDAGRERTHVLARFAPNGTELVAYETRRTVLDVRDPRRDEERDFVRDEDHWALLEDGRLFVAPLRNRYRLNVYATDGRLDRVIERDYAPYRRTDDERTLQRRIMEARAAHLRGEVEIAISDTDPDIVRVCRGPDGNVWIETSRGRRPREPGVMMLWDVLDPEGHFRRQVAVEAPHDACDDRLLFAGPDRVVVITGYYATRREFTTHGLIGSQGDGSEASGPMTVVMYRVVPSG